MAGGFFMTLTTFDIFQTLTGAVAIVNRFYAFGQITEKGHLWTEPNV